MHTKSPSVTLKPGYSYALVTRKFYGEHLVPSHFVPTGRNGRHRLIHVLHLYLVPSENLLPMYSRQPWDPISTFSAKLQKLIFWWDSLNEYGGGHADDNIKSIYSKCNYIKSNRIIDKSRSARTMRQTIIWTNDDLWLSLIYAYYERTSSWHEQFSICYFLQLLLFIMLKYAYISLW